MAVVLREVTSKKELKTFIFLPEKIHANHKNWVPPIYLDDWTYFDAEKNKSFSHCLTRLVIAYKDGEPVGRIMGVINPEYNRTHGEKNGRFSWMECYNDQEVAHLLLKDIEDWAKEKGMNKIVGPLAFSDKDPQGFLIEGFEEPVVIASNCSFPYMVDLMTNESYEKEVDLVVYNIPVPERIPEIYQKIADRFSRNNNELSLLEFTSRRQVRPFIRPVLRLVNDTFNEIYGFFPFSENEMNDYANRYLYLINPRYIKVFINNEGEAVAFVIGMSDIGNGIQKAKGRLLPFGFLHVLRASKRTNQLNLLLGAISPEYRGKGLDVMMGIKMLESARKTGKTVIDSHLELEYNNSVRAEMERLNGRVYKRFRIFQKSI